MSVLTKLQAAGPRVLVSGFRQRGLSRRATTFHANTTCHTTRSGLGADASGCGFAGTCSSYGPEAGVL
jgi:hypothetical protein